MYFPLPINFKISPALSLDDVYIFTLFLSANRMLSVSLVSCVVGRVRRRLRLPAL
jgi:cytochrome c biogenesis protein ResB